MPFGVEAERLGQFGRRNLDPFVRNCQSAFDEHQFGFDTVGIGRQSLARGGEVPCQFRETCGACLRLFNNPCILFRIQ